MKAARWQPGQIDQTGEMQRHLAVVIPTLPYFAKGLPSGRGNEKAYMLFMLMLIEKL